jgi:hypothetical protein
LDFKPALTSGLFFARKFRRRRMRAPTLRRHRAVAGMMLETQCDNIEPGGHMQTEQIGDYEIEYAGERLADVEGWGAFVTVYGPSTNPMHRNALVPHQRVAVEQIFDTEETALAEARVAAVSMLPGGAAAAAAAAATAA